jgi:hypothetical protein
MKETLVFDIGSSIIGIYCVEENKYTPYRGDRWGEAVQRLVEADEIVTYNGNDYDLKELDLISKGFKGIHRDMREICWSTRIWGSNLRDTYAMHYSESPKFPDTYEGNNERDVYETYMLWLAWKNDELKVIDGKYKEGSELR